MPLIRKIDKSAGRSKAGHTFSIRGKRRPFHRTDTPLQQEQSPHSVHVYKLNRRRESDAKCRANLCYSFEQLREQVCPPDYTHRVSREMILQETLWKIQYLQGILVLLQKTKDQKENKDSTLSGPDRLSAIHKDFIRAYICSSSHGNRKNAGEDQPQSVVNMENNITPGHKTATASAKSSQQQQMGLDTDRLVPQQSKHKWIHHDQVVPLPKEQPKKKQRIINAEDLTIPHSTQDNLPHTIIVPYITKQHSSCQEVPSSSPISLGHPSTKTIVRIREADSYQRTPDKYDRRSPSPMQTSPESVGHYKIKDGSIKSVDDGEVSWKRELEDLVGGGVVIKTEKLHHEDEMEPDLTCKEVIPYWLEEERNERRRMLTPLKHTNTTYPYPMAPRKNKNTKWSTNFMKQSRQNPKSNCKNAASWGKPKRQRGGKRLFVDTGLDNDAGQHSPAKRPLYIDGMYVNADKPPRRQYRKLCTAARVRPYDHTTGKVQSPVRATYHSDGQYKRTSRKPHRGAATQDPEFTINSYYRRKIKKTEKCSGGGQGGGKTVPTKVSPSPSRRQVSSNRWSAYDPSVDDVEEPLDVLAKEADADWTKHFRDKNQCQIYEYYINHEEEDADNSSQESLFLHDIPHLPEEIMYPLDKDDEDIVDTILQLEEDSIGTSIEQSSQGISEEGASQSFSSVSSFGYGNGFTARLNGSTEHSKNNIWSTPESQRSNLGGGCSLEQLEDLADCQIIDNISGSAGRGRTNKSADNIGSVFQYHSPIKHTPLVSRRSNPTLSSAAAGFLYQADDEDSPLGDVNFVASPLLTAAEIADHSSIIRMEDIQDVAEVHFSYDDLPTQSPGSKMVSLPLQDNLDSWQLEQLDMIGFNPDIDQLVGGENILVCSPLSLSTPPTPKQEVPQFLGTGGSSRMGKRDGNGLATDINSPSSGVKLERLSNIQEWLPNIITASPGSGPLAEYQVVPSFSDDDQLKHFAF